MASEFSHAQPERYEMTLMERIKILEESNDRIRQERDKLASELQTSQSENLKLQGKLINLQQVIESLQPSIMLARIEKTLEQVEFMDLDGKSKQDLISARQSLGDENSDDENELNPLDIVKAELFLKIDVDEANAFEEESYSNCGKREPVSEEETNAEQDRDPACLACDYEYADPDDYNSHLEYVHGLKPKRFECFHCGQILQRLSALVRHIRKLHKRVPKPGAKWSSIKSNESEGTKEEALRSKRKVLKKTLRTVKKRCVICDFMANRAQMVVHCKNVHGFTDNHCPCDKCPYVAKSLDNLKRHVRITHTAKPKQCKECGKEFLITKKLNQHMNAVHRQIKFKCEFCDHVTNREANLRQHVDAKHKGVTYFCDKCTFSSNYSNSLAYHMRTQHESPETEGSVKVPGKSAEKNYHCDQCVFSARNNAILQEHILVKHKGKRFQCDKCSYSSTTKYDLRKHAAVVHQGLPLKVHSCEFCDTKFLQVGTSLKHQRQRLENPNAKQYKCELCGLVFCFLNNLKKHKKHVHQNKKDEVSKHFEESNWN